MNAQIENLARQKDFAALNAEERAQVLIEMPEEEYNSLHQVLLAARMQHAHADVPAHIRANLMEHMAMRPQPTRLGRLLLKTNPIWRAAAIFILGMAAAMLMRKTDLVEKVVTEVQYKRDTVYRDNIQWRERVVWKTKVVYLEKATEQPIAVTPGKTAQPLALPEFNSKDLNNTAPGTSLGDTPELMQFFTQGEK